MGDETKFEVLKGGQSAGGPPIRVLLLDDREENLLLRTAILRQKGYAVVTSSTVEEATAQLADIDIAVLDYHLGAGKFGTEVADTLRQTRPQVPIIILSATLDRSFGGTADMHLLKGQSSVDDLVSALQSFQSKRQGRPVVIDSRDFYYSRIAMALGDDMAVEITDRDGNWQYVNDHLAALLNQKRSWFVGKNLFDHYPEIGEDWRDIIRNVADTRETYIDRRNRKSMPHLPLKSPRWNWHVLVFPLKLHDGHDGVVLSARMMEKK